MIPHSSLSQTPLALLGGSFDPIHYGHILPALEAAAQLGIGQIKLLPNKRSPLKGLPGITIEQKLAMLQLVTGLYPQFSIDQRELTQAAPNYTINTLRQIRQEIGDRPLCFLMGYDSLVTLPQWHKWQQLLSVANLVVCQRPGEQQLLPDHVSALLAQTQSSTIENPCGHIIILNTRQHNISATQIRQRVNSGLSIKGLTPDPIIDYIDQHQLYLNRLG